MLEKYVIPDPTPAAANVALPAAHVTVSPLMTPVSAQFVMVALVVPS